MTHFVNSRPNKTAACRTSMHLETAQSHPAEDTDVGVLGNGELEVFGTVNFGDDLLVANQVGSAGPLRGAVEDVLLCCCRLLVSKSSA